MFSEKSHFPESQELVKFNRHEIFACDGVRGMFSIKFRVMQGQNGNKSGLAAMEAQRAPRSSKMLGSRGFPNSTAQFDL